MSSLKGVKGTYSLIDRGPRGDFHLTEYGSTDVKRWRRYAGYTSAEKLLDIWVKRSDSSTIPLIYNEDVLSVDAEARRLSENVDMYFAGHKFKAYIKTCYLGIKPKRDVQIYFMEKKTVAGVYNMNFDSEYVYPNIARVARLFVAGGSVINPPTQTPVIAHRRDRTATHAEAWEG